MKTTYRKILVTLSLCLMMVMGTLWVVQAETEGGEPLQPYVITDKLLASDGGESDEFGYVLALSPDEQVMVVGARLVDVGGNNNQGQVYVYEWDGEQWQEVQKLVADDGAAEDEFGLAVDIAADYTIIVGAPEADVGGNDNIGAAYIFTHDGTTWAQQAKLTISDTNEFSHDNRGESVAIVNDGNTVFVGAPDVDIMGTTLGTIYVLTRSGNVWTQDQKIVGPASARRAGRAMHLSHDDNTLFVAGHYSSGGPVVGNGIVHLYELAGDTWTKVGEVIPSDSQEFDDFGLALATSGDDQTLLIGAFGENQAFVFTGSGSSWSERAVLTRPDSFGHFGAAVALDATGTQAAVGAWLNISGAIHIYRGGGASWQRTQTLITPDDRQEHLGYSVVMTGSGEQVLGGARHAHSSLDVFDSVGAVYVYEPGHFVYLPFVMK